MSLALCITELEQQNAHLSGQLAALQRQLDWFKRQLFGAKSEQQLLIDPAVQGNLLAALGVAIPPPPQSTPATTVTYTRIKGSELLKAIIPLAPSAVPETSCSFDLRHAVCDRLAVAMFPRPAL